MYADTRMGKSLVLSLQLASLAVADDGSVYIHVACVDDYDDYDDYDEYDDYDDYKVC